MGYLDENTPQSLILDAWNMLKTDGVVTLKNFVIFAVAIERIATNQMLVLLSSKDLRLPSGNMLNGCLRFLDLEEIGKVAAHF
jgi:hypothetical protein